MRAEERIQLLSLRSSLRQARQDLDSQDIDIQKQALRAARQATEQLYRLAKSMLRDQACTVHTTERTETYSVGNNTCK